MNNSRPLPQGLIHFYYGYGCGKTSIALGHVIRALGHKLKPIILQFLKKHDPMQKQGFFYGEFPILTEELDISVFQFGDYKFVRTDEDIQRNKKFADLGLKKIREIFTEKNYDLVILDEIGSMIKLDLISPDQIINLLQKKPKHIEIIMTGHEKVPELIEIADYVSHLEEVKHPFQNGIGARAGIDY